jgi:hypothetical protein
MGADLKLSPKIAARLAALLARTESSFEDEARTSALLAIQLMKKHGLVPQDLLKLISAKKAPRKKPQSAAGFASRGGKRGGPARAAKLTPERRAEIARNAAQARWTKRTAKLPT